MKKINYSLFVVILGLSAFIMSCGGGDGPDKPVVEKSVKEMLGEKVSGEWSVSGASGPESVDGQDYSGMKLTFGYSTSGGTMSVSGGPEGARPFNGSDTWDFEGDMTSADVTAFKVKRTSDDAVMDVSNFSESGMTLSFTSDGMTKSRAEEVSGEWSFTLSK